MGFGDFRRRRYLRVTRERHSSGSHALVHHSQSVAVDEL
jgi:hypothetical protein